MAVKEYNLDIIFYLKSQGANFTLKANVCRSCYDVDDDDDDDDDDKYIEEDF